MKKRTFRLVVGSCIAAGILLLAGFVSSQTSSGDPPDNDIGGNDSPGGVSTSFNGMVNTGCAYDAYTGNARREITDLVVPGAAGAYGLQWTRFYNSRDPDINTGMGVGWRHSYLWSEDHLGGNIVHFPDGRVIDFDQDTGRSERLPAVGKVVLGDGGQVIFEPITYHLPDGQHVKYRLKRIIDPYGLATEMAYENVAVDDNGNDIYRLFKIIEPAGRYLKLSYFNDTLIARVEAFDAQNNLTQWVAYTYTIFQGQPGVKWTLIAANYSDGTAAQYTYQRDNSYKKSAPGIPLLQTCDDVRYGGAMRQIEYLFVVGDRIRGKIKSEKKSGSGEAVSTVTFPANRSQTRVETRGDGPQRTFTYGSGGRLLSYTDFKNNSAIVTRLTYDANNFVGAVKDFGGHQTTYTKESNIGQLVRITHPNTVDYIEFGYSDPGNPYYLTSRKDERQYITSFDRDPVTHRVTAIYHPGGATERFWYTSLGQVRTHQRRNGYYDHFVYDSQGRLRKAWNPTATAPWPPADTEPHVELDYYPSGHPWADRVSTVKDQRAHSTTYEYDRDSASQPCAGRGLVTRITHLDGTYISFAYDPLGNVIAAENELRQRTNFSYDDYGRLITVAPPAPAGTTTFTYERAGTADPYLHTARAVHLVTDGAGVTAETSYDQNFRRASIAQLDGTDTPPTTSFEYWPVGLLKAVHDPRNYNWATTYTYDDRNQLETVTTPVTGGSVYPTVIHHDPAGNVAYVDRPDGKRTTYSYDEMNRVLSQVEPAGNNAAKTTTFTYWPSGKVHTVKDDNNQVTTFAYDASDRQQYMWFPDGSFEQWDFDGTNILRGHRTVGGKIERFQPDDRNRITDTWWDPGDPTEWAHFDYDVANRLIGAQNQNSTITRTYDNAGQLVTEEQHLDGLGTLGAKTVTYGTDGAGKRTALGLAGTPYQFAYHYDPLGRLDQLLNVENTPNGPTASLLFQYLYDRASNVSERYCPMNGVAQKYERDQLGRVTGLKIENATEPNYRGASPIEPPPISGPSGSPTPAVPVLPVNPLSLLAGLTNLTGTVGATAQNVGTVIASEQYTYDSLSRVTRINRVSQNESRGNVPSLDTYSYDDSGQLTGATYTAWAWNPNFTRSVSYTQDKLGNRSQVSDNSQLQGYSQNQNYLNQYTAGPAGPISNGSEHEVGGYAGLAYGYRNDKKLANVSGNGASYSLGYDALGRCVKRTLNGTTTYYTYDGPHPIYEWKADGTRAGWNLYGQAIDEILLRADYVVLDGGQGYFFQQDRLGSVTLLTGFVGEAIEAYRYDAFGTFASWTRGSFNTRFKFTGREYQRVFGIYEYRNRAYHPGLGRFLSEDPLGFAARDTNLYRYCGGDPVNGRDPTGLITVYGRPVNTENSGASLGSSSTGTPLGGPGDVSGSAGERGFFQGFERPNGDFVDTIPKDAEDSIVRAPPIGGPYYPPGTFPPGYMPGPPRFSFGGGASPWDPWGEAIDLFRVLITPAGGLVQGLRNGVTITENGGLGEGVQQQLTLNPAGITYRIGFGPGVGAGLSVTTAISSTGQVTGPNIQSSVSGGYVVGGSVRGTIGTGPTAYSGGVGIGIGFGATVTYGQTVFVPWPWIDESGG